MNADWSILYWIQNNLKCSFLDFLVPKITLLGDIGFVWIVIAIIFLLTRKNRRLGILLSIGLIAGVVIGNLILKQLICRPRPCWDNTAIELLISNPKDYSFPSGHTLSSSIAAIITTAVKPKLGFFVIPLALIIAFSRLYLFVHFPTDILGAMILGAAIAVSVILIDKKFRAKKDQTPT